MKFYWSLAHRIAYKRGKEVQYLNCIIWFLFPFAMFGSWALSNALVDWWLSKKTS